MYTYPLQAWQYSVCLTFLQMWKIFKHVYLSPLPEVSHMIVVYQLKYKHTISSLAVDVLCECRLAETKECA